MTCFELALTAQLICVSGQTIVCTDNGSIAQLLHIAGCTTMERSRLTDHPSANSCLTTLSVIGQRVAAERHLTYSPLAPAVDVALADDCRRARAAAPPARRPSHACESTGVPAITTPFALRHRPVIERPTNREDVFTFDLLDVGRE
jgi:hypothetical protein